MLLLALVPSASGRYGSPRRLGKGTGIHCLGGRPVSHQESVVSKFEAACSQHEADFKPTPLGLLADKYGLEPVHFATERKMLLGIKECAEGAATT